MRERSLLSLGAFIQKVESRVFPFEVLCVGDPAFELLWLRFEWGMGECGQLWHFGGFLEYFFFLRVGSAVSRANVADRGTLSHSSGKG